MRRKSHETWGQTQELQFVRRLGTFLGPRSLDQQLKVVEGYLGAIRERSRRWDGPVDFDVIIQAAEARWSEVRDALDAERTKKKAKHVAAQIAYARRRRQEQVAKEAKNELSAGLGPTWPKRPAAEAGALEDPGPGSGEVEGTCQAPDGTQTTH